MMRATARRHRPLSPGLAGAELSGGMGWVGDAGWDDWRWQLRHRVRSLKQLERELVLTEAERQGVLASERAGLSLCITPHILSLCDVRDPRCPVRRQVVPEVAECRQVAGDLRDPLGEGAHQVAPSLIRRYPDRALLLVTDQCAVHCRFCTRRRLIGRAHELGSQQQLRAAFSYLQQHPEVRDVIVSGGDPLLLGTPRLVRIVAELRRLRSVETIRLATRAVAALPQRVTERLVAALRPYHPVWVMTHFNHPRELDSAARRACARLADAGFPLMNQTVLLRGINDSPKVLAELFRALVHERVRPYYLMQADPAEGTGHLRTPMQRGVDIMERLQGRLSGIALPKLVVDTPGGLGKVPLGPGYVVQRGAGVTLLRTPRGGEVEYFDPP